MTAEHVDVLIVGAGLSGIGAAARLSMDHPDRSYEIWEMREASGGTWDLFRYPGVRSDSDMFTLGYRFRPWLGDTALADGGAILDYVRDTAREYGADEHIRYRRRVTRAEFDSATSLWTVTAETPDGPRTITCDLLWSCSGYYDYESGYSPKFPGQDDFAGRFVHPQHWPADLDVTGKRVVVIGSGATAVTLVPAMALGPNGDGEGAGTASRVTMVQRTPTYVLSLPRKDATVARLRRVLPEKAAYAVARWRNIGVATGLFKVSQAQPKLVRKLIRKANIGWLPEGYDVDTHFNPPYGPWDQRLCLVPDNDLFRALRKDRAEVVTGAIETITPSGVRMRDGREIDADVIVSATGLNLKIFGGAEVVVDGEPVRPADTVAYRAMMLSGVPNFVFTIGYTNASWTLKADLVAEYTTRMLRHMDEHGYLSVVPRWRGEAPASPMMDFEAGYIMRSIDTLPRQGDAEPWRLKQSYLHDMRTLRGTKLDDGVLEFR